MCVSPFTLVDSCGRKMIAESIKIKMEIKKGWFNDAIALHWVRVITPSKASRWPRRQRPESIYSSPFLQTKWQRQTLTMRQLQCIVCRKKIVLFSFLLSFSPTVFVCLSCFFLWCCWISFLLRGRNWFVQFVLLKFELW